MSRNLQARVIPPVAAAFIRTLWRTLRVRHVRYEPIAKRLASGERFVVAFWHGQLLMMSYARIGRPVTVMISRHSDGELIASTMKRFSVEAARGSTTRGGVGALRNMLALAKEGHGLVFTPDGPRGPRRVAQAGVVAAAQLTGLPILPIVFVAKKKSCCARGIGSRYRDPSPAGCFCTVSRSMSRAAPTMRSSSDVAWSWSAA